MDGTSDAASPRGQARVLVCEDDRLFREVLSEHLRALETSVDTANDGASALAAFHANTYEAIFLDVNLPDMTGFEVLERLKSSGHRLPPVVAVTGHTGDTFHERCLAAGFTECVMKPVRRARFMEIASSVLARSDAGSARHSGHAEAVEPLERMRAIFTNPGDAERALAQAVDALGGFARELAPASEREDTVATLSIAHRAYGIAVELGYGTLATEASAIERSARQVRWADVRAHVACFCSAQAAAAGRAHGAAAPR